MRRRLLSALKRNEMYVVAALIGAVFVAAMGMVAWMLRSSIVTPPYEALSGADLKNVFATGHPRFREDDGTPYLKVELHNGTLWWIKQVEFDFDGVRYTISDADLFRPLHHGALRCLLKTSPPGGGPKEYGLKIVNAYGYPPAAERMSRRSREMAKNGGPSSRRD
jgi:hypothetical protein